MESGDHRDSVMILEQRELMNAIITKQAGAEVDSVTVQMQTAAVMAAENIPDTKFVPLLELQAQNGVTALSEDKSKWYTGSQAVPEFQDTLADVCRDRMIARLQESRYVGIMLDESIDVAINKRLVVYFKLLLEGKPAVQFGVNLEVQDGRAETIVSAVRQYLASIGIPLAKIIGIGTDGASVMMGNRQGVTTVLKRLNCQLISTWCCAHRLSLVAHWASSGIQELMKVQATILNIYRYFKYSPPRLNKLKELKNIMGEKVRKFKKPTAVRWLSVHEAVVAVKESWGCLILTLENQATLNDGESSTQALSLLKEIKTYRFISLVCLLCDVLEEITKCSKAFQEDTVNIEDAMTELKTTLDTVATLPAHPGKAVTSLHNELANHQQFQNIPFQASDRQKEQTRATSQRFVDAIEQQAQRRFPDDDMETIKAMNKLLNPKLLPVGRDAIVQYGHAELEKVIEAFPQEIHAQRARDDFRRFKFTLNNHRTKSVVEMCTHLVNGNHHPDYAAMAAIYLVIPLTSVPCERAFSLQNQIKASNRSCMSGKSLNNKMTLISENRMKGFNSDNSVVAEATAAFQAAKKRRK